MRGIRVSMNASDDCMKLPRSEISDYLKVIWKVKFKEKYNDVYSPLSKTQKNFLKALDVNFPSRYT
jgi:hypothetical protein